MTTSSADNLWREHSIDTGCFINHSGVLLSISNDATVADGFPHSQLIMYYSDNGAVKDMGTHTWKVVSMAMSGRLNPREGFALGEDGQLISLSPNGPRDFSLGSNPSDPVLRGPLRKVRGIGDDMVVIGMNHQVLTVRSDAPWQDLSPNVQPGPIGGFEAVAGVSTGDMVCAGWRGEIWRRKADAWQQIDSPTNILITDIARGPDDEYVACGLDGLIVIGKGDQWRVLDQGRFKLNLHSVAIHEGRVYVASLNGLYELKNGVLYDIDYGDTPPPTTAHTVQAIRPGYLGLIGSKHLYLRDGDVWRVRE